MPQSDYLAHWTEGGDGITNFSPRDIVLYAKAIEEYNCADLYIGPPIPVPGYSNNKDKALRIRKGIRELGPFWRIFEKMREDAKTGKIRI